jgi:hypothetical protein
MGGTPKKADENQFVKWASNPQFVLELKRAENKKTSVFISLGQPDGRLFHGKTYPYDDVVFKVTVGLYKLSPTEEKLPKFDKTRQLATAPIKQYRELSIRAELENGKYVIIPSAADDTIENDFFVNIYMNCEKSEFSSYKVQPEGEDKVQWKIIAEEEEDVMKFDDNVKLCLKMK